MENIKEKKSDLLKYVDSVNDKLELSKNISPDYYEPGNMQNLDQYYGIYNEDDNSVCIIIDVKGLRYDNRSLLLDDLGVHETIKVVREKENLYNSNNFLITTTKNVVLGSLPAQFCNKLAPLYDLGYVKITASSVNYIEKISDRSRYAKQGVLFVRINIQFIGV